MQKFKLGRILITRGIADIFGQDFSLELYEVLIRHSSGDWGDVPEEDKTSNEIALKRGYRIISSYKLRKTQIWVITEADRSSTLILLPDEY